MASSLKFSRNIYSLESLEIARYKYREIATIKINTANDNYILCDFENCIVDEALVKNEFSNFVLALNIKKGF